jgi:hypothetical protein
MSTKKCLYYNKNSYKKHKTNEIGPYILMKASGTCAKPTKIVGEYFVPEHFILIYVQYLCMINNRGILCNNLFEILPLGYENNMYLPLLNLYKIFHQI